MVHISKDLQRRRRVEDWRIEVARVGEGDGDAHVAALGELPGSGPQVEDKLKRLPGRYRLKLVLEVLSPWEAEIVERGYSQNAMRGPQLALRDVGRIAIRIDLRQVGKHIQVWSLCT